MTETYTDKCGHVIDRETALREAEDTIIRQGDYHDIRPNEGEGMTDLDRLDAPSGLTFTPANELLDPRAVSWHRLRADYPCAECRERGGWMPQVWQSDCPNCGGSDPYGQPLYCGECEYCCGC